ncbi:MAG: Gfo/Idh/MocA family protein [Rhodospirillales bacterium]
MPKPQKPHSPQVAVVGCGHWGKNLVRNFHELGALARVHDVNKDVAKAMESAYGVSAAPFSNLLADDHIRGVVIATPAEKHAEMAKAALRAGKHVFVEKPLALGLPEAEALCSLAEGSGLVLMVGHVLQYHPAFEKLKEICEAGTLGGIRYAYSHRLNLGRIRTEENILWSFAPHDISMILDLLGDDPKSVSATGQSYLDHDLADVTTTHLVFPRHRGAHIFVSWQHPFKEQRLVVVGDEGMAVFDDTLDWREKVSVFPHRVDWDNGVPVPAKAERQTIPIETAEPLNLECRHFLDCIAGNATPRTDGREGLRVLRVLDAAQRSIDTGNVIRF